MATIPDELIRLIRSRLAEFQRQEDRFTGDIEALLLPLLDEFRRELETYFLSNFLPFIDEASNQPMWDPVTAEALGTVEEFGDSFDELVQAAEDELEPLFEEQLADGVGEGYLTGLWELSLGGADITGADPPPDDRHRLAWLLAGAVAGAGFLDRIRAWGTEYGAKLREWLKAATTSGMTFDQTSTGLSGILKSYGDRLTALGGDELHRSFTVGQEESWKPYKGLLLGEMWMTRQDLLVCPICMDLHGHMTDLEPVVDSHPRCRCWKVPIVVGENFIPEDYHGFTVKVENELRRGA